MTIKQNIENFIEHTFNDKIVDVRPIKEMRVSYHDIGERLEGYVVPVTYKYRGNRNVYFTIDNDHFKMISAEKALQNAKDYHLKASRKMYKNLSGTDDNEFLKTPTDVTHPIPSYDARGRIKEYRVVVTYYIAKMFMFDYGNCTAETEKKNAETWIEQMQCNGYKLASKPKYIDKPDSNSFNVCFMATYDYKFKNLPLLNAAERAWQLWISNQSQVSATKKNHAIMQAINENTK